MIDTVLNGRYQITELIGRGGMAYVYKALDLKLNRYVAVKVLKDDFKDNEQFIKKFNREAQSAARLSHPNIVSVYDVGEDDGVYFIVMEYVEGITLKQYLNRRKKLGYEEATNFVIDVAEALKCAHEQQIIHRDIKPHNILLTKDLVPKVTDFGIARAITSSTVTMPDQTMGSVHYISPEQARGGFIDARSDLYSLGIMYYELVTGELPFDEESSVTIAIKHIREEITPPQEINPDIPDSVNNVILKLTMKRPEDRYQNADELIEELDELLIDSMAPTGIMKTAGVGSDTLFTKLDQTSVQKDLFPEEPEGVIVNDDANKAKNKKKKIIIGSIIGGVVLIALIIGLFALFGGKEVDVPDVSNMTKEEAASVLESYHLKCEVGSEEYSATVGVGKVISQTPTKGSKLQEGKTVKIVLSKGSKTVQVPQVIGMTESAATKALEELKLAVEVVREYNSDQPSGMVYYVSPETGNEVSENATVTIYVSKGTESAKIPGIVGLTANDANARIQANGFTIGSVSEEYSSSYAAGVVMSQSPGEGTAAEKGTAVSYVVSKGSQAQPTPQPESD